MTTAEFHLTPEFQQQYDAVRARGGHLRVDGRCLLEITGADRQTWLHNLTTNVINSLQPGDGNYAFAINVKGRTLFDLNVLVLEDRLWLDVDRRWRDAAAAHLNKYIIVEDVHLSDLTDDWTRFWLLGPRTGAVVDALHMGANFPNWADLQHAGGTFENAPLRMVKHDLGPVLRAEFYVPTQTADAFGAALAERCAAVDVVALDPAVLETIRIEAAVPASVDDIDDDVIPPETLQIERGISYVKGCYLGQEVIERMRSRGSMARKLVGLKVAADRLPEHKAPVFAAGKEVGRVMSSCHSPAAAGPLALGYVKTVLVDAKSELQVALDPEHTAPAEVVDIPLPAWRG